MKKLKEILINPTAIAVAIMHWIVVIFSLLFENTQAFSETVKFHLEEPTLFLWLIYLNSPSLIISKVLFDLISLILGINLLTFSVSVLFLILCVTIQWLLIGHTFSYLIEVFRSKENNLQIKHN